MSATTTTAALAPALAHALVCPDAPPMSCGDDTPLSPLTPVDDYPQLSPSMRADQTPQQSPTASPMCPGAPRAPHRDATLCRTWGSVLLMMDAHSSNKRP